MPCGSQCNVCRLWLHNGCMKKKGDSANPMWLRALPHGCHGGRSGGGPPREARACAGVRHTHTYIAPPGRAPGAVYENMYMCMNMYICGQMPFTKVAKSAPWERAANSVRLRVWGATQAHI